MAPVALDAAPAEAPPATAPKKWTKRAANARVLNTISPIREIVNNLKPSTSSRPFLNGGLGDPSVYGNFHPPTEALDAICEAVRSGKADGYPNSVGYASALEAVAHYFDEGSGGNWRVQPKDVVMTHGTSGALEMAFVALNSPGCNFLIPQPLFTLYEAQLDIIGAEYRLYRLVPGTWEVDLEDLASKIDDNTAAILINNPSNPCGSNWPEAHLRDIAGVARRHRVPVIADEVYAGLAWDVSFGKKPLRTEPRKQGKFNPGAFTSFASICGEVPTLHLGGLSKRWLAPGWRTGWIIVHDPLSVLDDVREAMSRYAARLQGPSSAVQVALPKILADTPESFFVETMDQIKEAGDKLYERVKTIPGLEPIRPAGAMYLMVGGLDNFPAFKSDNEFVRALMEEQNFLILPGACFRLDNHLRFVTTMPWDKLSDACDRLEEFCAKYAV